MFSKKCEIGNDSVSTRCSARPNREENVGESNLLPCPDLILRNCVASATGRVGKESKPVVVSVVSLFLLITGLSINGSQLNSTEFASSSARIPRLRIQGFSLVIGSSIRPSTPSPPSPATNVTPGIPGIAHLIFAARTSISIHP